MSESGQGLCWAHFRSVLSHVVACCALADSPAKWCECFWRSSSCLGSIKSTKLACQGNTLLCEGNPAEQNVTLHDAASSWIYYQLHPTALINFAGVCRVKANSHRSVDTPTCMLTVVHEVHTDLKEDQCSSVLLQWYSALEFETWVTSSTFATMSPFFQPGNTSMYCRCNSSSCCCVDCSWLCSRASWGDIA